jgi:uncharacterized protein
MGDAALFAAGWLPWAGVCAVAFAASILGGLAGYGTGLVLPVFLAPLVGIANVVPVMALAMLLNNGSRVVAFWRDVQWPQVRRLLLLGLPACALGAWGYTLLPARGVALLLGGFLILSVPLRRGLKRLDMLLTPKAQVAAGAGFGLLNGSLAGVGVLLVAMLMSAGLQGAALIATDAAISFVMGLLKVALFGSLARLDMQLALAGLLVGLCTMPGAFVARRLLAHIPARVHGWVMEGVVVCGGLTLLWQGLSWR